MNLINWLGVGTVASTKDTNTHEIMVHLGAYAPTADGRTIATVESKQESSLNASGEMETSNTLVSNVFPATWRSMGEPNRITAPDVREGTKVSVYQVSGQNQYYWTTYGFGADTHRLETVVWGFQANPALDQDTPFDINNYYTATIDTRTGFFALRTSQANGEKSSMEVRLDGGNGRLDARGSEGSFFSFDDFNRQFLYTNKDGSIFGVDKKKISAHAPDSINLSADEDINLVTKNLNVQAKEVAVMAERARVKIPVTEWEGEVRLKGDLNQTGDFNQEGNTTSSGVIIGKTDVKTARVSLNGHKHGGVQNGDGVTGSSIP